LRSRSVRSRCLVPFASPVSSPASALRAVFSNGGRCSKKGRDHFVFVPVKETNSPRSEIRFPRCELKLPSFSRSRRFCRRDPRKRVLFALCRLDEIFSCEIFSSCHTELSPRPRDFCSAPVRAFLLESRFVSLGCPTERTATSSSSSATRI